MTSFGVGLPAAVLSGATAAAAEALAVASAAVADACFALLTALLLVAATAALALLPGDLCFAAAALSSAGYPAAASAAGPAFCGLAQLLPFSADIPAKMFCSGLGCFLGGAAAGLLRSGCRAFPAGCDAAGLLGAGSPATWTNSNLSS